MYFNEFNKILYDELYNVTDISQRISFLDSIKKNYFLTFDYRMQDDETPEGIAYDYYGDASLHWIILLINDIYDPVYGWHLENNEMLAYMIDKYGDLDSENGGYGGIHHWEWNDMNLDEIKEVLSYDISIAGVDYQVGDKLIASASALQDAVFEVLTVDGLGDITSLDMIDNGAYTSDSVSEFILYGGNGTGAELNNITYDVPSLAYPVSNREYEERINNKKQMIRILYPEQVPQIIQELQFLLK